MFVRFIIICLNMLIAKTCTVIDDDQLNLGGGEASSDGFKYIII